VDPLEQPNDYFDGDSDNDKYSDIHFELHHYTDDHFHTGTFDGDADGYRHSGGYQHAHRDLYGYADPYVNEHTGYSDIVPYGDFDEDQYRHQYADVDLYLHADKDTLANSDLDEYARAVYGDKHIYRYTYLYAYGNTANYYADKFIGMFGCAGLER
jgi:hypothetical protein